MDVFSSCVEASRNEKETSFRDRINNTDFTAADPFIVPDGMPKSIFENKYARKKSDGTFQTWQERITEVVKGNFLLDPRKNLQNWDVVEKELLTTLELAQKGIMPFAGRHLQHGDMNQPTKNMELFSNCSTSMFSFTQFYLLLKGSGVGRDYSSDIHWVDWDFAPNCRFVLEGPDNWGKGGHPDYEPWVESLQSAQQKYDSDSERVRWYKVEDSAEGWVKIVAIIETAAFHKNNREKIFVFDLSGIRPKGSPIRGQQGRPASGPIPLIIALIQMMSVKGADFKPWKQALYIDHYLASCVVLGGIRRSARLACKKWTDKDVLEFIDIKRTGDLTSANHSVLVDKEFWYQAENPKRSHARSVFEAVVGASYYDNSGEPAFINVDKLIENNIDLENITGENFISEAYKKGFDLHPKTIEMMSYILSKAKKTKYQMIVNPCSEITIAKYGAYCILGNICLDNCETVEQAFEAAKCMPSFLIRVNTMTALYEAELKRTNRIGVSLIGIHEFAIKHFNLDFYGMLCADDEFYEEASKFYIHEVYKKYGTSKKHDPIKINEKVRERSLKFWECIQKLSITVEQSANDYSDMLGLNRPHTYTTLVPGGTVAKVMNCTEAANLPSMSFYLRNVQYNKGDDQLQDLIKRGYPTKDISNTEQYRDRIVVGFPTCLPVCEVLGDRLVVAGEISIANHFRWLRLLEKYWLNSSNNQVSYTIKYNQTDVSFEDYKHTILKEQPKVKCCSFMPQISLTNYAYQPEEAISIEDYKKFKDRIKFIEKEGYDADQLACSSGICPIDRDIN